MGNSGRRGLSLYPASFSSNLGRVGAGRPPVQRAEVWLYERAQGPGRVPAVASMRPIEAFLSDDKGLNVQSCPSMKASRFSSNVERTLCIDRSVRQRLPQTGLRSQPTPKQRDGPRDPIHVTRGWGSCHDTCAQAHATAKELAPDPWPDPE